MAFPTTGVIDAFTYGDNILTTASANYTEEPLNDGGISPLVVSNTIRQSAVFVYHMVWRNDATYGPDCEAYIDIPTANAAGYYYLGLRIVQPSGASSTADGYLFEQINGTGLTIYEVTNGVSTAIGATQGGVANLASGDKFGAEVIGTTLQAYRYTGGAWSAYGSSRTDSTHSSAGYLAFGLYEDATTSVLDNFGGGTYAPPVYTDAPETLRVISSPLRW